MHSVIVLSSIFLVITLGAGTIPVVFGQIYDEVDDETNSSSVLIKSTSTTDFLTYEDKDLGFTIKYPSDWNIDSGENQLYTIASFDSPDNKASVDIRIIPQGSYKSLKDYGNKAFKQSDRLTLFEYYRNSTTLLGGQPAFKAVYLTTNTPSIFESAIGYKSSTSKALFTTTLVDEKNSFYTVVYFAPPSIFSEYRPIVEKMIDSFQILKTKSIIQEED